MQQSSGACSTSTATGKLADAALACLSSPSSRHKLLSLPHNTSLDLTQEVPSVLTASPHPLQHQASSSDPTDRKGTQVRPVIEASLPALPSLFQYVDHVLMRDKDRHDHPPHSGQTCIICSMQWDRASTPSTFLPLSPCNDWVHYRCLIWLATREGPHRDRCYACNTQLFEWDGISALTIATRTSLAMGNEQTAALNPGPLTSVTSDKSEYEQECHFIENIITQRFFDQLTKPSEFSDSSPDLIQCYDGVLDDLRLLGRPQSKWLNWSTNTGSLLFGMLVAVKMRRFLVDYHGRIVQAEAWIAWENGCRSLQRRILDDVHKE